MGGSRASLRKGFSESLNLELREEELTEAERERAAQLEVEKYRNSGWTERI
jgi:lipoate-protein ligase A